ncbi:MAG: GNAT family N-acetyltransferase [Oscillospiraceae bacterium]|nr:GNAT family N-acetyltransferase [Oscillospiraceae bacterium]
MEIRIPAENEISLCADVYISAYGAEPWNEVYEKSSVEKYISDYLGSKTKHCFAAVENGKIIGATLCMVVPSIGAPFLRIEDFCVAAEEQGKGFGSEFMRLVAEKASKMGCDSILLGTQRNFPSHKFYLKNGFSEVESVFLHKEL